MSFSVEDELIRLIGLDLPICILCMNNVSVLEELCEKVRLLEVDEAL